MIEISKKVIGLFLRQYREGINLTVNNVEGMRPAAISEIENAKTAYTIDSLLSYVQKLGAKLWVEIITPEEYTARLQKYKNKESGEININ
jgi:transcriptional regulator with XRE-family HTH domain